MSSDLSAFLSSILTDRYAVERELGRGGSAIVFLARDLRHQRHVAIKVLLPELSFAIGTERFQREVRLLAGLQHPNILPLLESGEVDGHLFFVTPFIEGDSLRVLMRRAGQLPVTQAVQLAVEIVDALAFAHERGVVHRDIKPENILMEAGHAVLADFGIALAIDGATDERITGTGVSVGTPAYMSPEQAAAEPRLDARSDIYSAGCVLYEMLTGEAPFSGPTAQAIIARRMATTPTMPRVLREGIPPSLERTVMRALARSPADRFQTAAGLREALERTRAETHAAATPEHAGGQFASRPSLWTRRRGVILAGAVAIGALAWLATRGREASPSLDRNLVAITPFEVLEPTLSLWKQGFVDVLAANLDGAGALRTVSPTVVMHRWAGRADRASALAVARSTGAGISIFGRLEPAGADSVRCTVWLDDASSGERLGEVALRESADRMDRLGDSLSIGILRALGDRRTLGAVRIGSLGSRTLSAIKFFLQGEQFLRRSSLDSARQAYERAVAIDSTFGLAMNRLGVVLGWQGTARSEEANRLMLTAARFVSGLAPRDSLQLTADALYARLSLFEPDTSWWTKGQALQHTLRALSARAPGDHAVWNAIGEAYFHLAGALGTSWDDALAAFDRAIALDSNFAPAWVHPIAIALSRDGPDSALRYDEGLQRVLAVGDLHSWPTIVRDIISQQPPTDIVIDRRLAALPAENVFEVWAALANWPDSAETAIRVARGMRRSRPSGNTHFDDPVVAQGLLVESLLDRGHFREALRTGASDSESSFPYLAMMGAIRPDSASAIFDRWVRERNRNAHTALPWWAARSDTSAIRRFAESARSRVHSDSADERHFAQFELRAADAYMALASRDSVRTVSLLRMLPDSLCAVCYSPRLTLAQLLLEMGQNAAADSLLRRDLTALPFSLGPADVYWRLARGQAAERVGATDRAAVWYKHVMRSYRYGDPEARNIAVQAEHRLSALAGTNRGLSDRAASAKRADR